MTPLSEAERLFEAYCKKYPSELTIVQSRGLVKVWLVAFTQGAVQEREALHQELDLVPAGLLHYLSIMYPDVMKRSAGFKQSLRVELGNLLVKAIRQRGETP